MLRRFACTSGNGPRAMKTWCKMHSLSWRSSRRLRNRCCRGCTRSSATERWPRVEASAEALRYLNRLSDLLFILAREANGGEDLLWEPGKSR